MRSNYKIAGLGEVLWDINDKKKSFGGAPANFASHCAGLGASAYVISCVGDDRMGRQAIDFLTKRAINVTGISTLYSHETGTVNFSLDNEGKPSYSIKENVAWDYIPFSHNTASIAEQLDVICFGTLAQRSIISRKSIVAYLDATKASCLRIFDMNIRLHYYSDEIIIDSLERANVLKLNEEELPLLSRLLNLTGGIKNQISTIADQYELDLVVLTLGAGGAWMITPEKVSFEEPPGSVDVVSTVGAGDSFTAASVIGFLEGKPLGVINRYANELASFVCTQSGAVPNLPVSLSKFYE